MRPKEAISRFVVIRMLGRIMAFIRCWGGIREEALEEGPQSRACEQRQKQGLACGSQ